MIYRSCGSSGTWKVSFMYVQQEESEGVCLARAMNEFQ